jgi:hypothetical protein
MKGGMNRFLAFLEIKLVGAQIKVFNKRDPDWAILPLYSPEAAIYLALSGKDGSL